MRASHSFVRPPAVAQDKGKTEAAELASESKAALQQLYASVPLAKELGPKAQAILVFPRSRRPASGLVVSMAKARC